MTDVGTSTAPVNLPDSTKSMGIGDFSSTLKGMSDPEFASYKAGLEEQKKIASEGRTEAGRRAQAQIMADYGSTMFSKPAPKFEPSQEDLSGFAALGALLTVSGAMMGSKGKTSGLMAMNAITGMMNGYQKGRNDLYEKERQRFEMSMKEWERERGQIKEAFDMALKMAPTNYKGAVDFLNKTLSGMGVTMPKAMIERSGLTYTAGVVTKSLENAGTQAKAIASKTGLSADQRVTVAQETARRDAEAKSLGTGALEYGSIDGVKGMYTRDQIVKAGPKFEPLGKPTSGRTNLEWVKLPDGTVTKMTQQQIDDARKAGQNVEYTTAPASEENPQAREDREGLAKALYDDFKRTGVEPVIKDEKLLASYKKLYPDAPFRVSDKQTTDADIISDTAVKSRVDRYLAGDKTAATGFGLSTLGQKNKNKFEDFLAKEMEKRGITGQALAVKQAEYQGIVAAERTLGTRAAYIELASEELKLLLPPLKSASEEVPRGKFVPISKLMQTAESSLSDPSLIKLKIAINGVQQAYVRALSPTGVPTDMLRQKASDMFSSAVSKEGIDAAIDQMNLEVQAALNAPDAVKEAIMRRYGGEPSAPVSPSDSRKAYLNGREIEVRDGKWVYSDTGEEAK